MIESASPAAIDELVRQHEIEQALYAEAALLDAHDYTGWLEALTEDVTY